MHSWIFCLFLGGGGRGEEEGGLKVNIVYMDIHVCMHNYSRSDFLEQDSRNQKQASAQHWPEVIHNNNFIKWAGSQQVNSEKPFHTLLKLRLIISSDLAQPLLHFSLQSKFVREKHTVFIYIFGDRIRNVMQNFSAPTNTVLVFMLVFLVFQPW